MKNKQERKREEQGKTDIKRDNERWSTFEEKEDIENALLAFSSTFSDGWISRWGGKMGSINEQVEDVEKGEKWKETIIKERGK